MEPGRDKQEFAIEEAELSGHILVVEDNAHLQVLISAFLQEFGHSFVVASSGEEALKCAQSQEFDVILMDIHMPGMNGMEATQAIRKSTGPARNTPIIALTAGAQRGEEEEYQRAGMNGYLSKPFDAEDLFRLIDDILAAKKTD